MGLLAGDGAGFPNGRRVSDDVTDISLRAVVGVLNPAFNIFPNNRLGDGVNANDHPYQETFPYVSFANSGRNSRHVNPGEPGCVEVSSPKRWRDAGVFQSPWFQPCPRKAETVSLPLFRRGAIESCSRRVSGSLDFAIRPKSALRDALRTKRGSFEACARWRGAFLPLFAQSPT